MMKKEDLLNDDFLKQFKTGDELESFLSELHKRGIEKMLEGEIDAIWIMPNTRGATIQMPGTAILKK
ncbi:MAG: hypothetical protein H6571_01515 [Lewinellaceae bacterium]|nr:hypothetical protein [Lewinellaceae bacterium]